MAPTQRPGRSAEWKSLPAMPTSPSRSAQARSRRLLPFEKPGPSTSMARKPWSTSARSEYSPEVVGWMCQCSNPAGPLDQGNRPAAVEPGFVHAGRAPVTQVTV